MRNLKQGIYIFEDGVVIEVEGEGDIEVEILCEPKESEELLDWAKIFYLEAPSRITLDLHPNP